MPPSLREPLTVIQEEAERASNIVKNLLSFARKQEHQRRPTALKPLLDATFLLLRNNLMAHRVEASLEVEPDLPMPDIDPNQIQQVFVNLINNAAQAIASTGRPGTVVVRARRWLDGVAIDVADDGPGMSEALAAQVFEPFFTTKPEGEGTGLGLSISQGIVREHGGRIMLSTEEERGSIFTVQLPLATRPPAPVPDADQRAPTRRLRVLVVDDEPHILHYMRATLEAWGHIPVVASDGAEALAVAGGGPLRPGDLRPPDAAAERPRVLRGARPAPARTRRAARLQHRRHRARRHAGVPRVARPSLPPQAVQPRRAPQRCSGKSPATARLPRAW